MSKSLLDPKCVPLALYIHVPWCIKKCPYCDFNSHPLTDADQFTAYVDALLADANAQVALAQQRPIGSIFIGGGTPSLLPVAEFERLFVGLQQQYRFTDDIEITLEVNPGTVEHAPFAQYLKLGINRLSIGVQSFDANHLARLGRIHDGTQAKTAIEQARQAGFHRLNVDLMHGLPKQTPSSALSDLTQALDAGATHLSWYQLTIEPNTIFYRRPPILPDEDGLADIEHIGRTALLQANFNNYEISAWVSKQDMPCRHNVNYWQFGDYLAIGAGAHGKITTNTDTLKDTLAMMGGTSDVINHHDDGAFVVCRFSKSRLPKDYLTYQTAPKMVSLDVINNNQLVGEFMMDALRLSQGFTSRLFGERTGLSWASVDLTIQRLQQQGLLQIQNGAIDDGHTVCSTELGRRYLNQVIAEFL